MQNTSLKFLNVNGPNLKPYIKDLAKLRMTVFRDYPYLYDGDLGYEEQYLQHYLDCSECLTIFVQDGDAIVGASTAISLKHEVGEVLKPFLENGEPIDKICYFGESVLLPNYRGKRIGHRFFQEREAFAASLHLPLTCFCIVQRPEEHPKKPSHYFSLEAFWKKLGYREQKHLVAHYSWKEIGDEGETVKPMQFWMKRG